MAVTWKPLGDAGWPNVIFGLFVVPASVICGVILSIIGINRHERCRHLSWVALVLNIVLFVYVVSRRG